MKSTLDEILKSGQLVDNSNYEVSNGEMSNFRFPEPIMIDFSGRKAKRLSTAAYNFLENLERKFSDGTFLPRVVKIYEGQYEHNTSEPLVSFRSYDYSHFSVSTGNLVGYVKYENQILKIGSRFGDEFLKFIISDAEGFLEIENAGGSGDQNGYDWLLYYLWKLKLKKAFRLGIPKLYSPKNEVLHKAIGSIDPVHFFIHQREGKYRCSYREHSYLTDATILISRVFKELKSSGFVDDIHLIRSAFSNAAQGETITNQDIQRVKHFSNPYYTEYNYVIDLSKRILADKGMMIGEKDDTEAFLFDVSMLFEYYIKKLLQRNGLQVASKDQNQFCIPTGGRKKTRKLEPDIVIHEKGNTHVFDVKYKYFDFYDGIKREDLFQLHTYLGQYTNSYEVRSCGFIFPILASRWNSYVPAVDQPIISDTLCFAGKSYPFFIFFLKIPDKELDFNKNMKLAVDGFVSTIKSNLSSPWPNTST